MYMIKKIFLPIISATVWISISEFLRNTYLLHSHWVRQYTKLGQTFPETPMNGAVWGLWSLALSVLIFILHKKYSLIETTGISWFAAFFMMWIVIGNMGILPYGILPLALPLSMLETFVASWIIKKFSA